MFNNNNKKLMSMDIAQQLSLTSLGSFTNREHF